MKKTVAQKLMDLKLQRKMIRMIPALKKKLSNVSGIIDIGVGWKHKGKSLRETSIPSFIIIVGKKFKRTELRHAHRLTKFYKRYALDVIETQPRYNNLTASDPLVPGISISNTRFSAWGTVGMYVQGLGDGEGLLGLTNFHVIVHPALPMVADGQTGDRINQPGGQPDTPENNIGELLRFSSNPDCAVFRLNDSRGVENSLQGTSFGPPVEPRPGMLVKKTGASTGTTFGKIFMYNNNIIGIESNRKKHPRGRPLSDGGDSGSVWVTDDASNNVIGLHYGGDNAYAFAAPMKSVFNALNVSM